MKETIDKYVGKGATIWVGGLSVVVVVKDVKVAWGKERFLVTPVSGSGEVWVESVKLIDKE